MGPPGAGKGTQAKRLAERFEMDHLSSGDIFRAEKASGSELGAKMAAYMDAGELVPDEVVVAVMRKAITSSTAAGGVLLDGFPRTVPQARALDQQLCEAGEPLDAVVVMTAEEDLIVRRLTGRRVCSSCGTIYHVEFMPPAEPRQCDACGGELIQRDDDTEEVVRQRLATYHEQTAPVIDYYGSRDGLRLIEVDGGRDAEDVLAALVVDLETIQVEG
jgi:adenylate kinase